MSKKKTSDRSLLVPGASGWEVWKQEAEGGFTRIVDGEVSRAIEIENLPGGQLTMFFPVRAMQALPFRAASSDDSLFDDLAQMHAERLGIRPDPMAGQLSDRFVVESGDESTTLLHVVLRSPSEGDLPLRTPNAFDLSARAFPVDGDAVTVWKEFGRWVFAIHSGGKLLYSQATPQDETVPGAALLREIHLALGQLAIQGLRVEPAAVHVWPPEGELGEAGALEDGLGVKAQVASRPDPVVPEKVSQLLPADVRAARRARQERNRNLALVAAAVVVYLGLIGWMVFGMVQDIRKRNRLAKLADGREGVVLRYQTHVSRWDELAPVVDLNQYPVEQLLQIATAIPRNSGLRLENVDINQAGIQISGNAPQAAPVSSFSLALEKNPALRGLDWETPPATNTSKGWDFRFKAQLPQVQ